MLEQPQKPPHRLPGYLLRLGITVILLGIAFRFIDFKSVWGTLKHVDLTRLFVSWVGFVGVQFLYAKRTQVLLRLQKMPASVGNIFLLNLAATYYSLVIPTSLAGGVVRWHRLSTEDHKGAEVLTVILTERLSDNLIWLLLLGSALYTLILKGLADAAWTAAAWLFVGGAAVGILVFIVWGRAPTTWNWIQKGVGVLPVKLRPHLSRFVEILKTSFLYPGPMVVVFTLGLALNLLLKVVIFNLLRSFVPQILFPQYLLVSMISTILIQFPISIGGIGLNELVYGRILPLVGVDNIAAVSMGLAGSLVSTSWGLLGGIVEGLGLGKYIKPGSGELINPQS